MINNDKKPWCEDNKVHLKKKIYVNLIKCTNAYNFKADVSVRKAEFINFSAFKANVVMINLKRVFLNDVIVTCSGIFMG